MLKVIIFAVSSDIILRMWHSATRAYSKYRIKKLAWTLTPNKEQKRGSILSHDLRNIHEYSIIHARRCEQPECAFTISSWISATSISFKFWQSKLSVVAGFMQKKKKNKQTEAVQQVIIDWHENHLHDHETRDVGLIVDHAPSGTSNAGMTTMPQNPPVYSNVNFWKLMYYI